MAYSATTGFRLRKNLYGITTQETHRFIIGNSATIKIGDAVRLNTSGFLVRSAAGEPVLGIVAGITDRNGLNLFTPQAQGTVGSTLTPDDQVAVSSTNQSDGTRSLKADVVLDPAGVNLYYNDASSTLAQTNVGQLFDVASGSSQIDQGTASDTAGQFQLLEIDPDGDGDASKGLFRIMENQLPSELGNSTAVVTA